VEKLQKDQMSERQVAGEDLRGLGTKKIKKTTEEEEKLTTERIKVKKKGHRKKVEGGNSTTLLPGGECEKEKCIPISLPRGKKKLFQKTVSLCKDRIQSEEKTRISGACKRKGITF